MSGEINARRISGIDGNAVEVRVLGKRRDRCRALREGTADIKAAASASCGSSEKT
jgi:hypothetical protein